MSPIECLTSVAVACDKLATWLVEMADVPPEAINMVKIRRGGQTLAAMAQLVEDVIDELSE